MQPEEAKVATSDAGAAAAPEAGLRRRGWQRQGSGASSDLDSQFECNICLDHVNEPVVTRCGHLFCWSCLYRWLHANHTECPVCKAGVSRDNVIPLYGRGSEQVDPRTKQGEADYGTGSGGDSVPMRPQAERIQAERPAQMGEGGNQGQFGNVTFTSGFGFFPSLFGLQFQTFTTHGHNNNGNVDAAMEAQQTMLSRLLLCLGTFVLLCLILF